MKVWVLVIEQPDCTEVTVHDTEDEAFEAVKRYAVGGLSEAVENPVAAYFGDHEDEFYNIWEAEY